MYQYPGRYSSPPQQRWAIGGSVSTPALLGQVLGITGAGFVITAAASYLAQELPYTMGLIAMFVGLALLFAINGTRANGSLSLVLFYLFAACEGVGIGPTIGAYVRGLGSDVVVEAAATTGMGMFVLGGVAWISSFDFRRLQSLAYGLLIGLVLTGIVSMFIHFIHPQVYSWATLGVFSVMTLVDFARIKAGGDGLSPVQMAIQIYLDGINIFLALLRIFGLRARED